MQNNEFRQLTEKEIATMVVHGCTADNWKNIQVVEDFSPQFIGNVHFSGFCKLGAFNHIFDLPGGVRKHSGIYNCLLCNCDIKNDVFIDKINNYIANYTIEEKAYIENTNLIVTDGESTFGNGIRVEVLNEGGGREIPIYNELSAPLAFLLTTCRDKENFISAIFTKIETFVQKYKSTQGQIGKNATIINCGTIKDTNIGDFAELNNVAKLTNGTVNSNELNRSIVGENVQATDFVFASGSKVLGASQIEKCFVGQGTVIDKQFSAVNSVFFANCQMMHGEAVSVFAGPYSVSHHKSTLLIALMCSFMNAGSGSNQSNHLYKLGPLHQSILGHGSKLGSSSYLLSPVEIGIYSAVLGKHNSHPDISKLPFSYLLDFKGESYVIPGANLKSVATARDAQKWQNRDSRKGKIKLDPICFELYNPYSIGKILEGIDTLKRLVIEFGWIDEYKYDGCKIMRSAVKKGIELYEMAIDIFIYQQLMNREEALATTNSEIGRGKWANLMGLLCPTSELDKLILSIETEGHTLDKISEKFGLFNDNYSSYAWKWTVDLIEKRQQKSVDKITDTEWTLLKKTTKASTHKYYNLLIDDAKKEFNDIAKISYGYENAEKEADFIAVRGEFESNSFVAELLKLREKSK